MLIEHTIHLLSRLSTHKVTGPDGNSAGLPQECSGEIVARFLRALFNMSLSLGKVPQEWREANVVPVHKKDDVHNARNFIFNFVVTPRNFIMA